MDQWLAHRISDKFCLYRSCFVTTHSIPIFSTVQHDKIWTVILPFPYLIFPFNIKGYDYFYSFLDFHSLTKQNRYLPLPFSSICLFKQPREFFFKQLKEGKLDCFFHPMPLLNFPHPYSLYFLNGQGSTKTCMTYFLILFK